MKQERKLSKSIIFSCFLDQFSELLAETLNKYLRVQFIISNREQNNKHDLDFYDSKWHIVQNHDGAEVLVQNIAGNISTNIYRVLENDNFSLYITPKQSCMKHHKNL